MKNKQNKYSLYLIAIVGIVAIVGIWTMVSGNEKFLTTGTSGESDLTGQMYVSGACSDEDATSTYDTSQLLTKSSITWKKKKYWDYCNPNARPNYIYEYVCKKNTITTWGFNCKTLGENYQCVDGACFSKELICNDFIDNDGDKLVDCADTDCKCWDLMTIKEVNLNSIHLSGIDSNAVVGFSTINSKMSGLILTNINNEFVAKNMIIDPNLFDVWVTSDNTIYAVGSDATVMRLKNGGTTSEIFYIPTSSTLTSIYGVNDNLAYIIGGKGALLKYDGIQQGKDIDDNTIQGTIVDLSSTAYLLTQFTGQWVSPNENVYITAYDGTVLRYNPITDQYTSLLINICKEVVGSSGQIVKTCKSNIINSNTKKSDYIFEGIWGSSETDIYVVGRYSGTSDTAVILYYDGTTWSTVLEKKIAAYKGFNAIFGKDASNIFVVGAAGTIVHYDGTTWEDMESNTVQDLYDVDGTDNIVYVVGEKIILQYTSK